MNSQKSGDLARPCEDGSSRAVPGPVRGFHHIVPQRITHKKERRRREALPQASTMVATESRERSLIIIGLLIYAQRSCNRTTSGGKVTAALSVRGLTSLVGPCRVQITFVLGRAASTSWTAVSAIGRVGFHLCGRLQQQGKQDRLDRRELRAYCIGKSGAKSTLRRRAQYRQYERLSERL